MPIEVAPPKDRFLAAAVDFVPPFLLFLALAAAGKSGAAGAAALFGSLYLIFRDVVGRGQSLGKRLCSLQVVDTETDRAPEAMPLILRNLGFGIPGLNVVYAIVEGVRVIRHDQGIRFGDQFAETGVVKFPPGEREKLLVPRRERPSREAPAVAGAPADAVAADGPAPADAIPAPPAAAARGPSAPAPIDVPPESPGAAAPARPVPPPPATGLPGVATSVDDPLKALIDRATAKK